MASPLRPSPLLLAAAILASLAPAVLGWMPLSRLLTSSLRFRTGTDPGRRSVLLSAVGNDASDDSRIHDEPEEPKNSHDAADNQPLFAEGDYITNYLSRLEALYDRGSSDSFVEDHTTEAGSKARRLLDEGDRVVLGDWMEWDGPCFGDSCGEEEQCDIPESYKVDAPKVDVMAFLGIKRAEPLHAQAQRDWD